MQAGSVSGDARPPHAVATLSAAADRMQMLDAGLRPDDGVRYFNGLYREVTHEVVRRLEAGEFEDRRFLEHLAVLFSNAYFAAFDEFGRGGQGSPAWAPLFAARLHRRVAPIQFALAGMNAHINYDLPLGVRDTCRALDIAPRDRSAQHRDYLRLNALLGELQERVKPALTAGLLGAVDRAFGRLDDVVASFSVARARDAAWVHAQTLHSLDDDDLSASYLGALERMVGLAGHGLVQPTLLGLGRWSSAQQWLPRVARRVLGAPRAR